MNIPETGDANEVRCIADEIIRMLFQLGELGQIQLLYMSSSLALKSMDKDAFRETITNQFNALPSK